MLMLAVMVVKGRGRGTSPLARWVDHPSRQMSIESTRASIPNKLRMAKDAMLMRGRLGARPAM